MAGKAWSREELIVAFNLYCKIPFGKIYARNPEVIALAKLLGRTPSALAWKLANFARLDPVLQARNISGAPHGSKADVEVWKEFSNDWESLAFESEKLLAEFSGTSVEKDIDLRDPGFVREGGDREAIVRIRVNQSFFRTTVLVAYGSKCCITGLSMPELLNASHIIPWSVDRSNRVNPRNGLCLNVMHDRAFDRGLMTVTTDYRVKVSTKLKSLQADESIDKFLLAYDGSEIRLPERFLPEPAFLAFHNENIIEHYYKEGGER